MGYTNTFVTSVHAADATELGVRLAKLCIEKDIPLKDVAEYFGVSEMTIRNWFTGHTKPRAEQAERVETVVTTLEG